MNIWSFYITAFSMGLISSFHCVVMCGPLSFALPVGNLKPAGKRFAFLSYNLGRVFTYSLLGMIIGIAGYKAHFFGWQQLLSIFTGVILLVMLIQKHVSRPGPGFGFSSKGTSLIYRLVSRSMHIKGSAGFFIFGMANGLLPCGMVYFALVTALNTDSIIHSVVFMLIFGSGTLPAMFALNITSLRIGAETRLSMKRLIPWFITFVAILLIFRGMNLGIPYLSPYYQAPSSQVLICEP
jgi:sulfite exporter TauE/SafE